MGRPVPKLILFRNNQIVENSPLTQLTDDQTSRGTTRSAQIQLKHLLARTRTHLTSFTYRGLALLLRNAAFPTHQQVFPTPGVNRGPMPCA